LTSLAKCLRYLFHCYLYSSLCLSPTAGGDGSRAAFQQQPRTARCPLSLAAAWCLAAVEAALRPCCSPQRVPGVVTTRTHERQPDTPETRKMLKFYFLAYQVVFNSLSSLQISYRSLSLFLSIVPPTLANFKLELGCRDGGLWVFLAGAGKRGTVWLTCPRCASRHSSSPEFTLSNSF